MGIGSSCKTPWKRRVKSLAASRNVSLISIVSSGSLQLIGTHRSTLGDREFDHRRRMLRNEIGQSLCKDREAWWSERAYELEAATASGNCRKSFQLIRGTGNKKSGVSETICEDDGIPITNIYRCLGRSAEFSEGQFKWSVAPPTSIRLSCAPWPVTNDPPNEAKVREELQLVFIIYCYLF
ncbi:unnamed protein product [Schistosoma bovis]|nr:unnamed protein product [Schistosoma bovis]